MTIGKPASCVGMAVGGCGCLVEEERALEMMEGSVEYRAFIYRLDPLILATSRLLSLSMPPLNLPTAGFPIPLSLLRDCSFLCFVGLSKMMPFSRASFRR